MTEHTYNKHCRGCGTFTSPQDQYCGACGLLMAGPYTAHQDNNLAVTRIQGPAQQWGGAVGPYPTGAGPAGVGPTLYGGELSPKLYVPPGAIQKHPGTHNVAAGVLISLLVAAGGGQMVNLQYAKGASLMLAQVVTMTVMRILLSSSPSYLLLGLVGLLIVDIVCLVDVVKIGNRINRGEVVGKWQWF